MEVREYNKKWQRFIVVDWGREIYPYIDNFVKLFWRVLEHDISWQEVLNLITAVESSRKLYARW